jgi:hypothetical protein
MRRSPARTTTSIPPGFVSAGFLVLALDFVIKHGAPHYSEQQLRALFAAVAATCLSGLAAGAAMLRRHGRRVEAAIMGAPHGRAGSDAGGSGPGGGALPGAAAAEEVTAVSVSGGTVGALRAALKHTAHHPAPPHGPPQLQAHRAGEPGDVEAPPAAGRRGGGSGGGAWSVAPAVAPAAAALLASVGTSMLAFPFFSYAPPSGHLGHHISQALFYARLGGDVVGRLMPPSLQARTAPRLLVWAGLKAALLPWLLPALLRPARAGGDLGLIALVAVNWVLSGYINTGAYLVAPTLVSTPAQRARVGSLMALCFQVGRQPDASLGVWLGERGGGRAGGGRKRGLAEREHTRQGAGGEKSGSGVARKIGRAEERTLCWRGPILVPRIPVTCVCFPSITPCWELAPRCSYPSGQLFPRPAGCHRIAAPAAACHHPWRRCLAAPRTSTCRHCGRRCQRAAPFTRAGGACSCSSSWGHCSCRHT